MHPHETLVREFYARFAARDAEGMARCYHPAVAFSDPVFPMLHAEEAFRRERLDARMLKQVHDELLVECPAGAAAQVAATLKREMENAVELDVPLVAETGIGDNWMSAKK